jgi:hypothetical protein
MKIAISVDGIIQTHALHWNGNYSTLCGLDGDDPEIDQSVEETTDEFITCRTCQKIILHCRQFTFRDFDMFAFMDDMKANKTEWPGHHMEKTFPEMEPKDIEYVFQKWFDSRHKNFTRA